MSGQEEQQRKDGECGFAERRNARGVVNAYGKNAVPKTTSMSNEVAEPSTDDGWVREEKTVNETTVV